MGPGFLPRHFERLILAACLSVGCLLCAAAASAATLHASPDGTGDGSAETTPASVEDALSAAGDGDEILLHEGDYGDLTVSGSFGSETFVQAAPDEEARLRTLTIQNAEHLTVSGLSISLAHAGTYASDTLVSIPGGSSFVALSDCDIQSVPDSEIGGWSASDWADVPGTGVNVRSPDTVISGNRIRNVTHGIVVNYDAPRATVRFNHIQNFSRDGLRGVADDGLFEYNTVLDAYDVDDHHDDFFQSWSYEDGVVGTTVVRGVVLRGNLFVNFTDPDRPFAGSAQGIGCFDGFFEDWVVENNVVIVDHWHGITFLGARNMTIVNNTVLDNSSDAGIGPPWIQVAAHKDGSASSDIVIRNNLSQNIRLEADDSVEDHNILFEDASAFFVDAAGFDLHLLDSAPAIDAGTEAGAPALDRDRILRPQGAGVDVGAFEWHDGSVEPQPDPGGEAPPLGGGGSSGDMDGPGGVDGTAGSNDPGTDLPDGGSGDSGGCSCRQGPPLGRSGGLGLGHWLLLAGLGLLFWVRWGHVSSRKPGEQ